MIFSPKRQTDLFHHKQSTEQSTVVRQVMTPAPQRNLMTPILGAAERYRPTGPLPPVHPRSHHQGLPERLLAFRTFLNVYVQLCVGFASLAGEFHDKNIRLSSDRVDIGSCIF